MSKADKIWMKSLYLFIPLFLCIFLIESLMIKLLLMIFGMFFTTGLMIYMMLSPHCLDEIAEREK